MVKFLMYTRRATFVELTFAGKYAKQTPKVGGCALSARGLNIRGGALSADPTPFPG